jgi:putative lipase involved disintegration of autophagic bodies
MFVVGIQFCFITYLAILSDVSSIEKSSAEMQRLSGRVFEKYTRAISSHACNYHVVEAKVYILTL